MKCLQCGNEKMTFLRSVPLPRRMYKIHYYKCDICEHLDNENAKGTAEKQDEQANDPVTHDRNYHKYVKS